MIVAGLLACLVIVNVLYVLHLERKDTRHDEQVNRVLLLVQAPEVAVQKVMQQGAYDPPAVDPFDENDYWEAERERAEGLARMAQLERDLS